MPNEIIDLKVLEVSLVDKAANQRKFLLFKSKDGQQKIDGGGENMPNFSELLEKQFENEDKFVLKESSNEVNEIVKGALRILNGMKDDLPKDVLQKMAETLGIEVPVKEVVKEVVKEKVKKSDGLDIDSLDVSDDVKEQLKGLWKSNKDLAEKLQKEMEDKKTQEFISKAKSFSNIPVNAEEFGMMLKAFADSDQETYSKFENVLKSIDEMLKNAKLFSEMGGNGSGLSGSNSMTKVEKMAETLRQDDQSLTKEQAIVKVLEQNPHLYDEYLNEGVN